MTTAKFPSIGQLLKASGTYVRKNFKKAMVPVVLFGLTIFLSLFAIIYAAVAYGQFSEADPMNLRAMIMIVFPAVVVLIIAGIFNRLWSLTWARGPSKSGFWRVLLPLVGLCILFMLISNIPYLIMAFFVPQQWQWVVSILVVLWTLYIVSRALAALLYVIRDRTPVLESIRKSLKQTEKIWLSVALRIVVFDIILVITVCAIVGLFGLIIFVVPVSLLIKVPVVLLLGVCLSETIELCAASFLLRVAEAIEKTR